MRIIRIEISDLVIKKQESDYPHDLIEALEVSIRKHGILLPLSLRKDRSVRDGCARVLIARKIGIKTVEATIDE